jgi:hypothetical protein
VPRPPGMMGIVSNRTWMPPAMPAPVRSYRSSRTSSHRESGDLMEATLLTKVEVDECRP